MPGMTYIGYLTPGVKALAENDPSLLDELLSKFAEKVHEHKDWFYQIEVDENVFFVADNGEDGYTAMLPDEY